MRLLSSVSSEVSLHLGSSASQFDEEQVIMHSPNKIEKKKKKKKEGRSCGGDGCARMQCLRCC